MKIKLVNPSSNGYFFIVLITFVVEQQELLEKTDQQTKST